MDDELVSDSEQLGNLPQAFSHLALLSAAVNLDHQLGGVFDTAPLVLIARQPATM